MSPGRRHGDEVASVLPFDGGPAEQALTSQVVQVVVGDGRWTALAPVTERGEVIGLLEIVLSAEPSSATLGEIARTAHALAFVVIANRRHTDLFEWGQRTTPFTLSAEIQRRLLPGSLGVGSLRNTRRTGHSLVEQAGTANAAIAEHAGTRSTFITAVLGRLDLRTGVCALLNAGHVPPLLVRDGAARQLDLPRNFGLGMFAAARFQTAEVPLEAGDRLVLLTDGMRERNAADLDLTALLGAVAGLHARETARALADAVLDVAGPELADDATLLVIDWHGRHGRPRNTSAGADRANASSVDPR